MSKFRSVKIATSDVTTQFLVNLKSALAPLGDFLCKLSLNEFS